MRQLTINHTDFLVYRDVLEAREEFNTHGNMRGRADSFDTGWLPFPWREFYNERRRHIDYTVLSYATPIAWHDDERGWFVPNVSYSTTTSKAQGKIRAALQEYVSEIGK